MNINNIEFSVDSLTKPVVVLIGPPGSGKTEVGRLLAAELDWTFWDTDRLIEQATGMTIPEIFDHHGEKTLRFLEKKLIAKIDKLNQVLRATLNFAENTPQLSGTVLSTGGGLPIEKENFAVLSRIGTIISLSATLDVLAQRALQQGHRPLLAETDKLSQKSRLELLVKERQPVYKQAQWTIDTSNLAIVEVVEQIKQKLKDFV